MIYCAPNPATSLLEVLVHAEIDLDDVPVNFRYLEIEVPDAARSEEVSESVLKRNWPQDLSLTRDYGDEWLEAGRTALLRVPSTIVPATWNVLINPRHPQARPMKITHVYEHALDDRLRRR